MTWLSPSGSGNDLAASTDNDHVVGTVVDGIGLPADGRRCLVRFAVCFLLTLLRYPTYAPKLNLSTAKIAIAATPKANKVFASSKSIFTPSPCT